MDLHKAISEAPKTICCPINIKSTKAELYQMDLPWPVGACESELNDKKQEGQRYNKI